VDPAKRTGLAVLYPTGEMMCTVLAFRHVPLKPREVAVKVADALGTVAWETADEWHLVIERMYLGANAYASMTMGVQAGQLKQAVGSALAEFATITEVAPARWRTVFGPHGPRLKRDAAKAEAIRMVRSIYRVEVPEDAAEAVCMGLWYQRKLEQAAVQEARAPRLGIALGRKRAGKGKRTTAGRRGRGRVTEAEALALGLMPEEDGKR